MASVLLQWLVSSILVAFATAAPQLLDFFSDPTFGTLSTSSTNPPFPSVSTVGSSNPPFGTFSTNRPFGGFNAASSSNPPFGTFSTASSNTPPFGAFSTTSNTPPFGGFSTVGGNPPFGGAFSTVSSNPRTGTFGLTDPIPTDTTFPFEFSTLSPTFAPTDFSDVGFNTPFGTFRNSSFRSACRIHFVTDDVVQWSSPNFGRGEYPNNARCKLSLSSRAPGYATFEFSNQGYDIKSGDFIDFNQPIRMAKLGKVWDGFAAPNTIVRGDLPTFNFDVEFRSDSTATGAGFNVTISRKTTDCHLIVNRDGAQTVGTLEAPQEPNYGTGVPNKRSCEWWIRAPEGKRIKLEILNMRITSSVNSEYEENGVVIVDRLGDKYYPELTSMDFVGSTLPQPVRSIGNRMNVIFYSGTLTDAFRARWSVIDA
ncbi:cubilin-like [Macrobrachium nipponense]|uniref:cubilin-like n=1 Tax=Macrobrachium nipponense TaxID=159736 RepID=UPI0030C80D2D